MSDWYFGPMTINTRHTWPCPQCTRGDMVFNGDAWMTTHPGYHHTCTACGFTTAIHRYKFHARTVSTQIDAPAD